MAALSKYVDTDATGSGSGDDWTNAYTSMSTAEAAVDNAYNGDNMTVYHRASSGSADTTAVTWNGATFASSADYMTILGDFAGTEWDASKYRLSCANVSPLSVYDNYLRLLNIQIEKSSSNSDAVPLVDFSLAASNEIHLANTFWRQPGNNSYREPGITCNDADGIIKIYNCIIHCPSTYASSGNSAIYIADSSSIDVYNCTVYGGYRNYYRSGGTLNVTNSIGANSVGSSFNGTITADRCCSDDGTGTNAQTENGGSWDNEFVTPGTDFALESGGNCVGNGTDNPGSGLYSDDITGTARTSTWDIGADEYIAAGGATAPTGNLSGPFGGPMIGAL